MVTVRTFDRLSTAKKADTLQVVKRLGSVWQYIVQVCIIRIRLTVDIAPICHQDESVRDMASVWMSYRMKSGVMSVALISAWRFEERQRLPDRRQMLPRRYEVIGLSRVSLSFVSRTLGTAVTGRRTTPLPTTCCHKLPPHCKAIV